MSDRGPLNIMLRGGDPATAAGHRDAPPRMGFFTDTSVCIGCKACEVACKEWNSVPEDGLNWTGWSHDNSQGLGADTWRHVAFVEQRAPLGGHVTNFQREDDDFRWLMSSDVCKHCTHAACLDVCPTGAIFRTEFGTVVVQADICNGCGYCVPACPYGVLDKREDDGRIFKCTLCYDRLEVGQEPACAKACPTDSIQFGELDVLRDRAGRRVEQLHEAGVEQARLYGHDPDDGVGGDGAFFLLLDEPEVYGLPPDPVVTTRDLPAMWRHVGLAAGALLAAAAASFAGAGRSSDDRGSYYGTADHQPAGVGGARHRRLPVRRWAGGRLLAPGRGRRPHWPATPGAARASCAPRAAIGASLVALINDLGRPARFVNMLRVFKPTSPMSVGTWILSAYAPLNMASSASALTGRAPRAGRAAGVGAGLLGPAVASYTAALIADTAVPAWHEGHRELPFLFAGSAASAGAGFGLLAAPLTENAPAQRLAVLASVGELVAEHLLERRLGMVAETMRTGTAGRRMKAAKALSLAGALGAGTLARRNRFAATLSGGALIAGSALTRFGIFAAGMASARDPKYTVEPQRARLRAR